MGKQGLMGNPSNPKVLATNKNKERVGQWVCELAWVSKFLEALHMNFRLLFTTQLLTCRMFLII